MSYPFKPTEHDYPFTCTPGRRVGPSNPFVEFKTEDIERSIPSRFEQQVARYPDRLAVKTQNQSFTYDALNKAANHVAHAILAERDKVEEPIALLVENSALLVVAMLGVLKAGKFYVPLDHAFPYERKKYMLEDSQAGIIITNNQNLSSARGLCRNRIQLLNIDELNYRLPTENLSRAISPDTLMYVIYTSGSTGLPKGVLQNHRNMLHVIMNYTNDLHIGADDRLALLSSFSFSSAMKETFGALLNGAALYPLDIKEEGLSDLAKWLIQEEITVCKFSTTVFRHFAGTLSGKEEFSQLRLIHVGGEPVYKRDFELYKRHFSPECLFLTNLAGTEFGQVRQYFMNKETQIASEIVPVGYAVRGKDILLLDDDGKEVGFNCVGEIAVKSRYLSPGYWKKPDLTRAAFIPDPDGGSKRIYKTGDLGLMLPDGCLVHLGRKDSQAKVRGHRIDTAEIERSLLGFTAVKEVIVLAREDTPGDRRIVAYIVAARGLEPTVVELRSFLKLRLPEYMIPSAFVRLNALPLMPNGKVDRLALPAPSTGRPELTTTFVAARTPVEEILAGIWADVLGLNEVGVEDNFFDLGGDSLRASQITFRVRTAFKVDLPLRSIFDAPTVAELALMINKRRVDQTNEQNLDGVLAELETLSEEEAQRLLARMIGKNKRLGVE
jgi:amino acid adenylation domain-containing protein